MKKYLIIICCFLFSYNAFSLITWGGEFLYIHDNNGSCDGGEYVEVGFNSRGEINNDYVEIYKSLDASFTSKIKVGNRLEGCGTCSGGRIYSVFDYGPFAPNQVWYYHAEATSNAGVVTEHKLDTYSTKVPTIANWINQVTSSVSISSTPNTASSYMWASESRLGQGITISLSPTEISKIYVEENNNKFNFALDFSLSMLSIEVNVDNSGYFSLYAGSLVSNYIWDNSANYFTGLGEHNLKVRFADASGTYYYREYRVFVVPKSDALYYDNYCNTMRVWKSAGIGNKIPILLSEGFDAYNTKPEQYYRKAGNDLMNCLADKGFDLYVINYKYNSQSIRNNAAVFSSAIRYISSINNGNKVIAAGISMGGIINRYACAKAENDGNPLPISKFVTLDAPHQGAVISYDLQDWRKGLTQGDGFAEHASNNDAAKELLNYCAYDPTASHTSSGVIHTVFFNELNRLNGDGYPHLVPTIGVSFSTTATNPNSYNTEWLHINVTGAPGNNDKHIYLNADELVAGSFLPSINIDQALAPSANLNDVPFIDVKTLKSFLLSFLRPFSDPSVTVTQYAYPSFIPHNSSLDIINTVSKFNVLISPSATGAHDEIPSDIIEPLLNALINENLYLQDKTITDTRNYIASNKIEAGNSVTTTFPNGDFILTSSSNVTMTAGNQIILDPGFIAQAGSQFIAQIGMVSCDGTVATQQRSVVHQEEHENNIINKNQVREHTSVTIKSTQNNNIGIMPNPNNGTFQITITKNDKAISVMEIKIYDIMGKVIWSTGASLNSTFNVDISNYSQGIYYVRSVNEAGDIEMKKFIKH